MKIILSTFVAVILIPAFILGQTNVTKADLNEINDLAKQGNTDKALEKINTLRNKVTVKDSLYIYLINKSAQINSNAYNCEDAIRDDEEIIKLSPSSEGQAQSHIGQMKTIIGDYDGAIAAYTKAMKLDKANLHLYDYIATAYNRSGKYRDAIRTLASKPKPNVTPQEFYQYAIAFFNLNKLDSAKLKMDVYMVAPSASNDFGANEIAAQIYAARGDKKKGCEFITKAMDLITSVNAEEQIQKAPAKMLAYAYVKEMIREINSAKDLKTKICTQ